MLDENADINSPELNGMTLLFWSMMEGNVEAFEMLLEYGANPHIPLKTTIASTEGAEVTFQHFAGDTVLFSIVGHAYLRSEFFCVAMKYIHQPNQRNSDGMTLLHVYLGVNSGLHNIKKRDLQLLVLMGVDVNAMDKKGLTACRYAIKRDIHGVFAIPVCRWLLAKNADPSLTSEDGTRLLDDISLAIQKMADPSEFVTLQKELRLPSNQNGRFHSPTLPDFPIAWSESLPSTTFASNTSYRAHCDTIASKDGAASVRSEIAPTLDINYQSPAGMTLLLWSYLADNQTAFQELLELGASPDVKLSEPLSKWMKLGASFAPEKQETVLMTTEWNPDFKENFFEMALGYTEAPNAADLHGRNILHRFLYYPRPEQTHLLQKIIKTGIDLDAKTLAGMTACHLAARHNPRFIPVLVDAGADPHIRNRLGESTLQLLSQVDHPTEEHQRVLEWLVERSARE
ncbi:ankyrin repeat domain-containing protein [Aureliella helgolandensis]|nr:hypothetical protein [Aureliella helgolandensis]